MKHPSYSDAETVEKNFQKALDLKLTLSCIIKINESFELKFKVNLGGTPMNRPHIACHMMTSVDGRIDCAMTEHLPGVQEY